MKQPGFSEMLIKKFGKKFMVDIIKEPFNITFHKSGNPFSLPNLLQSCMTPSPRSETMRRVTELRFKDYFQNQFHGLLYNLVFGTTYT